MELLNREDIEMLLQQKGYGPCISIYMPTESGREKAKANSIRFKNLVAEAEEQLDNIGIDRQEKQKLLGPAKQLIDDSYFWSNQTDGFAYFISPGYSKFFRLPIEFNDFATVRESFHIKPLFRLLASDGHFYVLALSQKDARLLRCTQVLAEEIDTSDLIRKFEDKFSSELPEEYLQFHARAPASGTMRTAIHFGHGGEIDSALREKLLKYFRFIDSELQEMLDEKEIPMILACVDHIFSLYREASKYPMLFEEKISGNPENMSKEELHRKGLEIVQPYFQHEQENAKARYRELQGTGRTSNQIEEIVPASFHGRISDIFVAVGVQQWGNYDPENNEIKLSEGPLTGNEDLIDLAAAETFLNNGKVFALEKEQMPDNPPAAAVFRW
ncbi:MAG: hypothetical protein R6U91_09410 [Bacillota bacterium]